MIGLRATGLIRASTKHSIQRSTSKRSFTCCVRCAAINPLLNLSGWSGSKEAQYFSKEKKIPRVEFSPYLELIRSSEVDPFAPAPGASPTVISALKRAKSGQSDIQTAYSLAVANLVQQLESSRRETRNATIALNSLYDKYQKQERHALVVMLTAVTLLSLAIFWPNFMQDTWDDVQSWFHQQGKGANPHKLIADRSDIHIQPSAPQRLLEVTKKVDVKRISASSTKPLEEKAVASEDKKGVSKTQSLESPSTLSRLPSLSGLFWKS